MGVNLTQRTAQKVVERTRKDEGQHQQPFKPGDLVSHFPPRTFRNDSSEEIPAYACMKVTDAEEDPDTGSFVVVVDKPNNDGGPFVFNGPNEVEAGGYGQYHTGGEARAKFDSGTPTAGETWGPKANWYVEKHGQPAILVYGALKNDANEKYLLGNTDQRQLWRIGKSDGSITAGSTGTMDIYDDPSTDSGNEDTVSVDWMDGGENISTGKEIMSHWFDDEGEWRITGAECE